MRADDLTATTRTVLERYGQELYDGRDVTLVPELLAEPMYRHDAGGDVTEMSNADCVKRIGGVFDNFSSIVIRTIHLVVEGSVASWTYELTAIDASGSETIMSSIETFKVTGGRITDVWNAEHTPGPWL